MLRVTFVICLFVIISANASKILVLIPTPSFSHQITFRNIWLKLLERGHHITFIGSDLITDPKLVNLTNIDTKETYKYLNELYENIPHKPKFETVKMIIQTFDKVFEYILLQEPVQALIKNEPMFDLVITEHFFMEFFVLSDLYKCPRILISSLEIANHFYDFLGSTVNPEINPDIHLPFLPETMTFKERLISFSYHYIWSFYKWYQGFPVRHNLLKKYIGEDVRTPQQLLSDIDLILTNTNPVINDVRSMGPNIIPFGGGVHIMPQNPLPKDLKEYLDNAKEGCIYFSLGTNCKSMYIGEEKIKIILETLGELPYKVIWKFEVEDVIKPPKNVKLISWAPQVGILRHPNIKLFITQGGIQSLEESIIFQVPVVILPNFGDQFSNAKRMEYRGIGREVKHQPQLVKENFKSIILDVITNPKYKEKVIKTSELLLDQPMNGVDKAVWWIEYVIRHKGAKHLRNPAMDAPLYRHYCLDVMGAILLSFFIVYKISFWILRALKNLIWPKPKVSEEKKKK